MGRRFSAPPHPRNPINFHSSSPVPKQCPTAAPQLLFRLFRMRSQERHAPLAPSLGKQVMKTLRLHRLSLSFQAAEAEGAAGSDAGHPD